MNLKNPVKSLMSSVVVVGLSVPVFAQSPDDEAEESILDSITVRQPGC